jgi:2-keto-4-pentenoate hydratase/2-oxohepta-3-ene-1,7-dioic acid hydratase in catechol pathway
MRILRIGEPGHERPAVVGEGDDVVELSGEIEDVDAAFLARGGLRTLEALMTSRAATLPRRRLGATRVGPPVGGIGKMVCVGLNYKKHAAESGQPVPTEPILFLKSWQTVVGAHDDVLIPPTSEKTDWEVELAVVIGKEARYLSDPSRALDHVAGYAISNDVSERAFQFERGGQWDKGKNCETFNPLGPWLVTPDEVGDPQALGLMLSVNGEVKQRSSTADMIFSVAHLVWYTSQFMVLYAGDVINTGTPEGVGLGQKPPQYLRNGDVVELSIERLGVQRQRFVRARA